MLSHELRFLAVSMKTLRHRAEAGEADAQYRLGCLHDAGEGVVEDVVEDVEEALRWHLAAAEQGHPGAQWRMGYACREGEGVERDDVEAVCW